MRRHRSLAPVSIPVLVLFLLAGAALVPGGGRAADLELVQSAPVETDLAEPGIPFAKDVWLELAREARRSIDLAQFYLANAPGSDLEPVLAEIERAAARGVRVRVLLAPVLLDQDRATLARLRALKGAEVAVLDLRKRTGGILHAKYWIVDGREAFVGSQNFDWRALAHIHELGLRVREPLAVAELARIFEADWALAHGASAGAAGAPPAGAPAGSPARAVEVVASPPALNPPGIRPAIEALVELLAGAKRSLRIQLLDYSPVSRRDGYWGKIDVALRAAEARGVKVALVVSHWNAERPEIDHLKSLGVLPGIDARIATVPLAKEGFIPYARVIHAKYMVVDDETLWLGTSNWARDYFLASRNVELIVRGQPELARKAAAIHERVRASAMTEKVDPSRTYPRPRKEE